jgi:recombination protein RecT
MANNQTQIQAIGNFSVDDLQTMKHTLAVGATDAQFNLFVRTATASGLNPFLNHIYCIVYGGKMSIQVSVEGIVYLAKRVEGYQGIDTQLVHENDDFEASITEDGSWRIDSHKIKFPRGKVIAAYAIAYREGFRPYTVFMDVDEVQHHLTGNNATNWKKYFNDFFKKTVTKRAAKGQFGIEISEDETPDGGGVPAYEPQRRDITAEVNEAVTKEDTPSAEVEPKHPETSPEDDETAKRREINGKIKAGLAQLEITDPAAIEEYMKNNMRVKEGQSPTLAQRKALLKVIELEIEQHKADAAADDEDLLIPE